MEGRECRGEESCGVHRAERHRHQHPDCAKEQWFGLYCAKYQRFYCAGKGNCASAEQYMVHLNAARTAPWRP